MNFAAIASVEPPVSSTARKPRVESERLFEGSSEIVIVHRAEDTACASPKTASSY